MKPITFVIFVLLSGAFASGGAVADEEGGRFHFDLGLSYISGLRHIDDGLKAAYQNAGYSYDSVFVPVGLKIDPYYLFPVGLGIGGSIGPVEIGQVSSSSDAYGIIPVGLDVRWEFLNDSGIVPYIRGGARYPIAIGNLVHRGTFGPFGAVGVQITRWHVGFEVGYDASEVRVGFGGVSTRVKPIEFMAGLYIHL